MLGRTGLVVATALIVFGGVAPSHAANAPSTPTPSTTAHAGDGGFDLGAGLPGGGSSGQPGGSNEPSGPPIRWVGVTCDYASGTGPDYCHDYGQPCPDYPGQLILRQEQQPDGTWLTVAGSCPIPVSSTPSTTASASPPAQDTIQQLVPSPPIGVAPTDTTLVGIETLFWLKTAADRTLGPVTLLRQQIELRIHLEQVDWNFGDRATATRDSPDRPYDPDAPCSTRTCDRYWGHVYTETGAVTVSATATWSGEYRVVGADDWIKIDGTATAPPSTLRLTVRQARGVLVS